MKPRSASPSQGRNDIAKLIFLFVAVVGAAGIFILNPAFSSPTLLAIVITMLLSPWVASLERRGLSRNVSIMITFGVIALLLTVGTFWAAQSIESQWNGFREKAPEAFTAAMQELRKIEENARQKYSFLSSIQMTESMIAWGQNTGRWFVENGASMVGSLVVWVLIVPFLTFVMLSDGREMRRKLFQLVPNRHFESFFIVSNDITKAISDYLSAKLIEAFLVGLMTTLGLLMVGAPYALVLGIVAGITNIIPYLGPFFGAIPAFLVLLFDPSSHSLIWPVSVVYIVANVIDNVVIFPVVVAKLVNLHPLLLIAVVAIGQQYYGLVGMLISIPIATACKVILTELYAMIYGSPETFSSEEGQGDSGLAAGGPADPGSQDRLAS